MTEGSQQPRPGEEAVGWEDHPPSICQERRTGQGKPSPTQCRRFIPKPGGRSLSRGMSCLSAERMSGVAGSAASQGGPRERQHPSPCLQVSRLRHGEAGSQRPRGGDSRSRGGRCQLLTQALKTLATAKPFLPSLEL